MTESTLRPARAFHDLNGVDVLEIAGWSGRYEVKPHALGNHGVSIIAPRRIDGEFWTFQRQHDGVLKCHSDLIGSPSLLTADRIDTITIRFEG